MSIAMRGEIRLSDDLPAAFPEAFSLKGAMHKLGHAFGLPHNGPLQAQDLGMPLMGPTIDNYRKRTKTNEARGYLSARVGGDVVETPGVRGHREGPRPDAARSGC
ncbi:MAG: hypothetical protein M3463_03750 [Verrucomicrobiota bacterium]|nr:hypothetical protein [Verrucomicrobiota bacterium]